MLQRVPEIGRSYVQQRNATVWHAVLMPVLNGEHFHTAIIQKDNLNRNPLDRKPPCIFYLLFQCYMLCKELHLAKASFECQRMLILTKIVPAKPSTHHSSHQSHEQLNSFVYSKTCFCIPDIACNTSSVWLSHAVT